VPERALLGNQDEPSGWGRVVLAVTRTILDKRLVEPDFELTKSLQRSEYNPLTTPIDTEVTSLQWKHQRWGYQLTREAQRKTTPKQDENDYN
jgi:hypothetical protein